MIYTSLPSHEIRRLWRNETPREKTEIEKEIREGCAGALEEKLPRRQTEVRFLTDPRLGRLPAARENRMDDLGSLVLNLPEVVLRNETFGIDLT